MKLPACTALITGASAGLGIEFARQLSGNARALILIARRQERLEKLRDELRQLAPALPVHIRAVDLSKLEEVDALCRWLKAEGIAVDLLVNNAGLGDHGPFASSDETRLLEMIQVNILALTYLTRQLLPPMIAARRGGILNVSSSASFLPLVGLGVYAATKAYVTSFTEALRLELRGSGIKVTALCPGPVHTEFNQVATRVSEKNDLGPEFIHVTPAKVVRTALQALIHDRPLTIPGWPMRLAMSLVRMTPMPILRLAMGAGK